jgi:hypothetical protein
MALPKENRTDKVTTVEAAIGKMSSQELGALPNLDAEDFKIFGTLIQHFAFIDLNLRRALEIFQMAKMLPENAAKQYPDLQDAALTDAVIEVVKGMDAKAEGTDVSLTWLDVISKCRGYRNLVGHFAAKRFPNADVYVFASKSDRGARKVLGDSHPFLKRHVLLTFCLRHHAP